MDKCYLNGSFFISMSISELKNVRKNIENFCKENVNKLDIFLVKLAVVTVVSILLKKGYFGE